MDEMMSHIEYTGQVPLRSDNEGNWKELYASLSTVLRPWPSYQERLENGDCEE